MKGKLKIKPKPKPADAVNQMDSHDSGGSLTDMGDINYQDLKPIGNKGNRGNIEDLSAIIQDENTMIDDRQQTTRGGRDDRGGAAYKMNENKIDENDAIRNNQYARDERRNREDKEQTDSRDNDRQKLLDQQAQLQRELELEFESEEQGREYPQKTEYTQEIEHIQEVEEINEEIVEEIIEEEPSVENLYGYGKRYPEPYLAGKPPNELVHMRQQSQREGKSFVYAVRFRMGPLGLSFDNRVSIVRSLT